MEASAIAAREPRLRDRIAAAFILLVLMGGTLVLWIGIPVACLWAASKLTNSIGTHFLVALPLTLTSMIVFAWLLYRVDRLYLRVTGAYARLEEDEDDEDEPRVPRGPLEPMMIVSLVIAAVALLVWFFVFAEDPPRQVI